jgi:hypothetical protein
LLATLQPGLGIFLQPGLLTLLRLSHQKVLYRTIHSQGEFMKKLGIIPAIALAFSLLAFSGAATAVEVGQKAPDFDLASTQGGKFKLSDMAGKKNVLVQFYLIDFTPI